MNSVPEVWRRFFDHVMISPPAEPRGSLIHQTGEMRLENGKWVPFTAEQRFEATGTAFSWHARAKLLPLVTIVVEDAYENGHGRLEAKLFGAVKVMSALPGPDLDRRGGLVGWPRGSPGVLAGKGHGLRLRVKPTSMVLTVTKWSR